VALADDPDLRLQLARIRYEIASVCSAVASLNIAVGHAIKAKRGIWDEAETTEIAKHLNDCTRELKDALAKLSEK
jgi:hypothetical protein